MMLKHSLTVAITLLSASALTPSAARAQLTREQFSALQRTLNEAERLKPLCDRATELGLIDQVLMATCETYFGGRVEGVEREKAQLEKEATEIAAGLGQAESKVNEAAEDAAAGRVEESKRKIGEGVALADKATEKTTAPAPAPKYSQKALADDDDGKQKFGGIEFGIGIGFTYDLGNRDRIIETELVGPNQVVRVKSQANLAANFILETHYLFTPCSGQIFNVRNDCKYEVDGSGRVRYIPNGRQNFGFGPFVALRPGSETLIDGVGAGLMIALRRPGDTTQSFNLGLGVFYDLRAKVLAEGIIVDEPLPPGETGARLRTTSQSGVLVLSSYSF